MVTKVKQAHRRTSSPVPTADGCRHHWVIERPNGPTANGVCRLCGDRRLFRTSSDDYIRDDGPVSVAA